MDEQQEMAAAVDTASGKSSKKQPGKEYSASNLKGLVVQHDQEAFKEGQEIILTLKDKNILKASGNEYDLEEEDDVLVNVNIADDEKAAQNIENKKKKPVYNPYDEEYDQDGNVS